jgi:excinuclease ABC subunit B
VAEGDYWTPPLEAEPVEFATTVERDAYVARLEKEMREAAKKFEFERAATLRDRIRSLKQSEVLA